MDIAGALQSRSTQLIGPSAIFYALLAIGLNLHFGYAGLLNFGQIGFALLGGYGVGDHRPSPTSSRCGSASSSVSPRPDCSPSLLGIPTLRLRADYLAIVTIAASEILRLMFRSTASDSITGSTSGLFGFADPFTTLSPFDSGKQYNFLGVKF